MVGLLATARSTISNYFSSMGFLIRWTEGILMETKRPMKLCLRYIKQVSYRKKKQNKKKTKQNKPNKKKTNESLNIL